MYPPDRPSVENWKLAVNVVNVTNHRVLTDSSLTIGGFHYNDGGRFRQR